VVRACSECNGEWFSSYLAGGDELKRPEGGLHVRDVGLELVERSRDAGLDLIGLGPRGAVGRDLVEGLLRHDGRSISLSWSRGGIRRCRCTVLAISQSSRWTAKALGVVSSASPSGRDAHRSLRVRV
jgi:hypothetical protein